MPASRARAGRRAPSQSRLRSARGSLRTTKVHRPSGAYFSTTTSTTPKMIVSKLPLVPISLGSSTCSWSSSSLTTAEPRKAPHRCETPPSTAMNRYSIPLEIENGEGLIARWKNANNQPETAASTAASTKATSL